MNEVDQLINQTLPEELQQKATPPIPLRAPEILNPLAQFDIRTPQQIKEQVKMAEDVAKFFKSHWLWFYISAGLALWRGYLQTETNKAIRRIDRELHDKKKVKNPRRKRKK